VRSRLSCRLVEVAETYLTQIEAVERLSRGDHGDGPSQRKQVRVAGDDLHPFARGERDEVIVIWILRSSGRRVRRIRNDFREVADQRDELAGVFFGDALT
jgi:hypothetical protein